MHQLPVYYPPNGPSPVEKLIFNTAKSIPLPFLPYVLQNVNKAVANKTQAPYELVFSSSLSTLSTTLQSFLEVEMPRGGLTQTALYMICIAPSGSRKTSIDNMLNLALRNFEMDLKQRKDEQRKKAEIEHSIWVETKNVIQKEMKKALQYAVQNDLATSDQIIHLQEQLKRHMDTEPVIPPIPKLLYTDVTIESLLHSLKNKSRSALLCSSEGGMVFNKISPSLFGYLNILWESGAIDVERKMKENLTIDNAILSINIMTQPSTIERLMKKQDSIARASGFAARVLFSEPLLTQGTRLITDDINHLYHDQAIDKFKEHVYNILTYAEQRENNNLDKIVLHCDQHAKQLWINFYNWVETQLSQNNFLFDINDFASKITNNVCRIAGILHFTYTSSTFGLESKKIYSDINAEAMNSAIQIGMYYLAEFKRLFGVNEVIQEQHEYANLLRTWLRNKYYQHKTINNSTLIGFTRAYLYKNAPNKIRKKAKLDLAINTLVANGLIFEQANMTPAMIYINQANITYL